MKNFFIDQNSLTRKAIIKINKLGGESLIVVKNKNILRGILSPRDLRKAIINNNILNKTINKIFNKKPKFIFSDELKKNYPYLSNKIKRFNVIPIVERKTHKILDILTQYTIKKKKFNNFEKINCCVVIMAGGKGSRLKPYTEILPKPLLPINETPAIKLIMDKFNYYSPTKYYVTLNYKSEILKSYFKEIKNSFKIKIINEKKPMGTVGGLYFLKNKIKSHFFLANCDTIIKTNYSDILNFHIKNKNDITIVVANKIFSIPYGVCETNTKNFKLIEKPKFNFKVNTGFYIINKNILKLLKKKEFMDFNTLLTRSLKCNKKIGYFTIKNTDWIDVGQMDKYKNFLEKGI